MSHQEKFLERWSRKKRESSAAPNAPETVRDTAKPRAAAALDGSGKGERPLSSPAAVAPEFDLSTLPSIDSITAGTDIRCFFAPGVPPELTRAALRRVWSTDPAVRDFVGLEENAWDFNSPNSIAGFAERLPEIDIKKIAAQLLGDQNQHKEESEVHTAKQVPAARGDPQAAGMATESARSVPTADFARSAVAGHAAPHAGGVAARPASGTGSDNQIVQCEDNDASHKERETAQFAKGPTRRLRGSALPRIVNK